MEPFVGEIRAVGFNFAPRDWALCDGSLIAIRQYTALFSLLGTQYGGDGKTTFALPDLRGRAIVGVGSGPGLSPYSPGQQGGTAGVSLLPGQLPSHSHSFTGTISAGGEAESVSPGQAYPGKGEATQYSNGTPTEPLNAGTLTGALSQAGGSQPHENRQPSLVLNYAIATSGTFPSRG